MIGRSILDQASLSTLVADLFTAIHLLSGYPAVDTRPEIHLLPQAVIADKVCQKPCGVRAYYHPEWGVLLDETLKIESDPFDRSILLHELVHHVQSVRGRFDSKRSACDRWNAAEREAYSLQNRYLAHVNSRSHVHMSGFVANCDGIRTAALHSD